MPSPRWVDTHAHLTHSRLVDRVAEILATAAAEGVIRIVSAATCAEDALAVTELATNSSIVRAAVGIHPNDTHLAAPGDWDRIVALTENRHVVAIGETGLDKYWKDAPFDVQLDFFARHLDLAERLGLPVVIHCRDAMPEILEFLETRNRPVKGTLHCFTGTLPDAQRLMALGLHLGFGGICTFRNKDSDTFAELIRAVPEDRILVETDAPFLSPHPFRGKTNEPARVAVVGRFIAELRGWPEDKCSEITTQNALALFADRIDGSP
ncbi:YchF/TatD family DNA exonuclease [bacterium]|nr:YchF/TatD family DNA exonuclease [bacterium]